VTTLAATFCLAAAAALALTPLVARLAARWGVLDQPGPRRAHAGSVPRLGGLAVVGGAACALLAVPRLGFASALALTEPLLPPVLAGGAVVLALGVWDDVRGLPAAVKLALEILAASLVVGLGVSIERVVVFGRTIDLGVLGPPATVAWIVVVTNAFNLIDGLDGLATGVAIISGATCATLLVRRGHAQEAELLAALLGAASGFLPYNVGPARIFLGDCGSLVFGFMLAVTSVTGLQKGATALSAGALLLLFALPILDTVLSVWRRSVDGTRGAGWRGLLRILAPDQEHVHHRLVAAGLRPRTVVWLMYGVTLVLCLAALQLAQGGL
jgi:UDP-GlcNAc:undecaprenyl-phosphate GlcNAc-1-phosphate transferase